MRFPFAIAAVCSLTMLAHAAPKFAPSAKIGVAERTFHPEGARDWRQSTPQLKVLLWYPAAESATETKQFIGPPDAPLFEAGTAAKDAALDPAVKLRPLIMLSHGTGGSAAQMAWLGTALAHAGFLVAAVDHPGNNADEPYTVEGFTLWWERATDISQAIDGVLADPEFGRHVDKDRIGAAGFSLGGFTVLQLAGAETDVHEYFDLCDPRNAADMRAPRDADTTVCHVEEMRAMGTPLEMLRQTRASSAESLASSNKSFQDEAVRAVFAIAPALGFTLDDDSLRDIHIPVEVVVGKLDRIAIARDNADYIHAMIHGSRETQLPGVNHYTFLDVCTRAGREKLPAYCSDAPGTEREAVHAQVAAMAVKFFLAQLR
jgi:predicted dienelactone hydrolase